MEIESKPNMDEILEFKGKDPGAVQFGNFINYYHFHPPEERIKVLPTTIWNLKEPYVLLDIGCNTGELSYELLNFFSSKLSPKISMLGVDIDPILIERADEMIKDERINFKCLDVMNMNTSRIVIDDYLRRMLAAKYSITFCFSTTMWIHLNHGDEGLRMFLKYISGITEMLVIEAQPWKCYRNAVKRMKRKDFEFDKFGDLKMRDNVEQDIEKILINDCNMVKAAQSERTKWQRKVMIFKTKE